MGLSRLSRWEPAVHAGDSRLAGSDDRSGGLAAGAGVPLAEVYLEFLAGRCRPNTVLAAAYDLRVFFTVVGKPPERVRPADVLTFITAQRTAPLVRVVCCSRWIPGVVSAATVRRRFHGDQHRVPVARGG